MKKVLTAAAALVLVAGAAFAQKAPKNCAAAKPAPRVVRDTTTIYDVSSTDKKGTTQYGVVQQTQSTPEGGTRLISQVEYADYTPSKMALANAKKGEMSIGVGGVYSFNKDSFDARYANIGLAGTAQVLWEVTPAFALGVDYMLLTPHSRNNHNRGGDFKYEKERVNAIGMAGKLTLNAWDRTSVYIPLGVNMSQVRMKSFGVRDGAYSAASKDKWGLGLFAGLGVQYTLTENMFLGVEYRYIYDFVKDSKVGDFGRDKNFQYHAAFLRLGSRF